MRFFQTADYVNNVRIVIWTIFIFKVLFETKFNMYGGDNELDLLQQEEAERCEQ